MLEPVRRREPCPSDLDLEAFWVGEAGARRLHGDHLATCPSCGARLAWMREAEHAFEHRVLPATLPAVLAASAPRRRSPRVLASAAGLVALAAAAAVLLHARPPDGYVGAKGAAGAIEVYVRDGASGRRLANGDRVRAGDALRFVVRAPGRGVLVFSVDALGRVSRLYPARGEEPLRADGVLPGGAILDDTPGPERIFAFYLAPGSPGQSVVRVEEAARAAYAGGGAELLRSTARLPLPLEHESILLEKVPPAP